MWEDEGFGFTHANTSHYKSPPYICVNLPFMGIFKPVHLFSAFPLVTDEKTDGLWSCTIICPFLWTLFSTPAELVLISYNADSH